MFGSVGKNSHIQKVKVILKRGRPNVQEEKYLPSVMGWGTGGEKIPLYPSSAASTGAAQLKKPHGGSRPCEEGIR